MRFKRNEGVRGKLSVGNALASARFTAEEAVTCPVLSGFAAEVLRIAFTHDSFAPELVSPNVVILLEPRPMDCAGQKPPIAFDMSSFPRAAQTVNRRCGIAFEVVLDVDGILTFHQATSGSIHHVTAPRTRSDRRCRAYGV